MLSENLKIFRKKAKISQSELAKKLQISQQGYANYETGRASPSPETLVLIAKELNCSLEDLLEVKTNEKKAESIGTKIPVFSQVAAGIPISAIDDIIDWEEIPLDMANIGEFFGLVIKGDSMEPRMTTGDVVIVQAQSTVETGDIAIVRIDGENATCKKIKKTPEGIMLISLNPSYEPMFYTNKEIEQLPIEIVGKVVELRAKL